MKEKINVAGLELDFAPYPAAVKHAGLVFVSGVRSTSSARATALKEMASELVTKEQGFGLADHDERKVSTDAWATHANLETILRAAGTSGDRILRQHIWQRDKRFFPSYERVRVRFQETPAPSSGVGVSDVLGDSRHWIGLDAIAVIPGDNPDLPARSVVAGVDNRNLPSAAHYSQAVRSGDLAFTAGFIAIKTAEPGKPLVSSFEDVPAEGRFLATGRSHPDSRDGPIAAQTWYIYNELKKVLDAGGIGFGDVILSTVYLADLRDFAVFHRVHRHFFGTNPPALSVSEFDEVGHRGCRVEIELTALAVGSKLKRSAVEWSVPAPYAAPAGISVGPVTFYSGMVGIDRDGLLVSGSDGLSGEGRSFVRRLEEIETKKGLAAQCWASFERLAEAVKSSGSRLGDLLKMTVYVSDQRDLRVFDAVRTQFIDQTDLPAFELVCVFGPGPVSDVLIQDRSHWVELIDLPERGNLMKPTSSPLAELSLYEVDHLGIAVPDLEAATALYRDVLGCPVGEPVVPPGQGIAIVFVQFGNVHVELLMPTVDVSPIPHLLENYTINDFLERQPKGGLHHVCYVVDDLKAICGRLNASGVRVLGTGEPIIGASGLPIVFLDPATAAGTLIELKQKAS